VLHQRGFGEGVHGLGLGLVPDGGSGGGQTDERGLIRAPPRPAKSTARSPSQSTRSVARLMAVALAPVLEHRTMGALA
jgi:hypothetical protein